MVVCVARYASKMSRDQVKNTRVAVFANTSARKNFSKALRYLDEAIAAVDTFVRQTPPAVITSGDGKR